MSTRLESLGNGISIIISKEHGFGTDAVLLADFAAPKKSDIACDLGTGCGIIPLLWCREDAPARTVAVDIQESAIRQVKEAINLQNLSPRLKAVLADLKDLKGLLPEGAYDLVTCNPPYSAQDTGCKSENQKALIVRHEVSCTVYDVAKAANYLLKFGGRLCLCQRPERLCDVLEAMREATIEPKRLRFVQQRKNTAPWLFLVEGKKGAKKGLRILPPLIIENENGSYSDEMKRINHLYYQQTQNNKKRQQIKNNA